MQARLRIVQLVHAPQRRGAEVFARDLAGALRERGHEVSTVYLYRPAIAAEASSLADPGALHLDAREGTLAERLLGIAPGLLRTLRLTLAGLAPDVVQANGGNTLKYAARAAGRRSASGDGWRLVYRNIGDPRAWLASPWKRLVYRRAIGPRIDGVAAVAVSAVAPLRDLYGPEVPIAVLPTAVDPRRLVPTHGRIEVRAALRTPEAAPVVVAAGRLAPEKRIDRLLRAIAMARAKVPDLQLWIAGDGPQRETLEATARDLGLSDDVRFLGVRNDLPDLFAAADLLALTSDTEGVPGVVLEAAALALPAVATSVGGVPECVADGETGVLVAPESEEALAEAIASLASDADRRRALGKAAHRRVRERFALEAVAAGYEDLYRRVLARERA